MSAEQHAPSASEYIVHHLTHWQNKPQTEIVDFSVFNLDSLFFSVFLGLIGLFPSLESRQQSHFRGSWAFSGRC
jgi:F-type H+-transporting ATPase subunit a